MTAARIDENNLITVLIVGSAALVAILAAGGLIFVSGRFAAGVLAGGTLAIANFCWLRTILVRTLKLQISEAPRYAVARYVVRLAVLAVAVYLLLIYGRVDVFGLLLGLSVLVINIIALSLFMITRQGD